MTGTPIKLLVSVRDGAEARVALEAGADGIDVKDPSRGPLGYAGYDAVKAVVDEVAGRVPVSAALGEFGERKHHFDRRLLELKLDYLKWGPSKTRLHGEMMEHATFFRYSDRAVGVFYADWHRAKSPGIDETVAVGLSVPIPFKALLLDTFAKDGRSLFQHISPDSIRQMHKRLEKKGTALAVAGSIAWDDLPKVKGLRPEWLAVRGLVCEEGMRTEPLDAGRIAKLKALLAEDG